MIANAFATFILTFIGVSISSRKIRGGMGLHLGIGLLISFSYILFMQFSTQLPITEDTYEQEDTAIVFMQDGSIVTIVMNEISL